MGGQVHNLQPQKRRRVGYGMLNSTVITSDSARDGKRFLGNLSCAYLEAGKKRREQFSSDALHGRSRAAFRQFSTFRMSAAESLPRMR